MASIVGYDRSITDAAGKPIPHLYTETSPGSGIYSKSGEAHIGAVSGHTFRSEAVRSRPNDATAYTANDAVMDSTSAPTAINFPNCARVAGGGITLMQARMTINKVMGATKYRLHLFRATPASPPNDNAPYAQTWANASLRLGYVDFATPVVGSNCTDYFGTFVQTGAVPTVLTGTSVFGILQVLDAVTPAGTDQFLIVLTGYAD